MTQRKELMPVDLEALEDVDGGWGRRYGYGYRPMPMMGGGGWGSSFFGSFLGSSLASLFSTPRYAAYQAPVYGPPPPGQGTVQPTAQPVVVQSRPLMELALGSFRFSLG